jgi:serine/threonine protein kinase
MGEVYKAQDLRLDRTVALKLLPHNKQDDEVRRRFVREAKALSALNHPNIATIYEIDDFNGVSFIAMEYIGGRTLKDILGDKTLTVREALDLAIPVAEALSNAHEKNIIHRDIKPTNIMVSDDGYVKVLDFGLAKSVTDSDSSVSSMLTQAGTVWGTIPYMSPEQAMGVALDQRSDIFSFGSVLYEVITGLQPFTGSNPMAILHAVTFDHPVPISRLKPEAAGELERVVNKTLQKKAAERYQSLKDALVDLKRLRKDLPA